MNTSGAHVFQAKNLHVQSFGGKIRIEPWSESDSGPTQGNGGPYRTAPTSMIPQGIEVTLTGSEERIKAVKMMAHRDELVYRGLARLGGRRRRNDHLD